MMNSPLDNFTTRAARRFVCAGVGGRRSLAAIVAFALLVGHFLEAQSGQNSRPAIVVAPYPGELGHPGPDSDTPTMDPAMARKRLQAINADRQKSMVSDTNKLLKLARELSAETAAGDSKKPSGQQVHKAAEIEKLAHNVRDKMTYVISGAPGEPTPLRLPN